MSPAQAVQIVITLIGIGLGVLAFLFAPFSGLVNGVLAFAIFVLAGTAAGLAHARLSRKA